MYKTKTKSNNWPSVSVIVLNYNGKDLSVECVDSVLVSNYPAFDIVLVDNGSTDDSFQYLKDSYRDNKKVTVIRSERNRQFTGGFNFGARHSRGEKITLLSNDIVVDPDWITELVAIARNNNKYIVQPKIMMYQDRQRIDHVGGAYSILGFGNLIGRGDLDRGQYDRQLELHYASATMFMIDRRFFLELGGYDEWYVSHYEDVDLALRAKKKGGRCLLAWKSKIYHKGSVTYKRYVVPDSVLFHIRKNRLRTVLKNFRGAERMLRLALLQLSFFPLIVQDLFTLRKKRMFLTLCSIVAAFRPQTRFSLEEK